MLSRKTAKTLADLFHERFKGSKTISTIKGPQKYFLLRRNELYDFLYERDYDAWFLNAAKGLSSNVERALKNFVMRLHTGESVVKATQGWTWEQRSKLGQRLLRDLAEDILIWYEAPDRYFGKSGKKLLLRLKAELELDGYIFRDGKLYYTEAAVLDTEGEEGILAKLIRDLALDNQDVMDHHLELSGTHYVDERWDDSIANSRKFLESVLQEIAAKYHSHTTRQSIAQATYSSPYRVRDYLENQGLIEPKEKEAIAKIYGLLSETGGHPYIAERDQARLMRYLALTFAQFALLRFQGALRRT
jgi:hypothetical protein